MAIWKIHLEISHQVSSEISREISSEILLEISHPKVAPGQRAGTVREEVLPEAYMGVECWDAL